MEILFIVLQVTVYLGKRDFVDHLDHVDPIGESSFVIICAVNGAPCGENVA